MKRYTAKKANPHHQFLTFCGKTKRFTTTDMSRVVHYEKDLDGIVLLDHKRERILERPISLHPECAAFLFHLEGCPRRLLMYFLYFEVDRNTCELSFNSLTKQGFKDYCLRFDTMYTDLVIKKAIGQLTRANIVISIARGRYMMNPLLFGGSVTASRQDLINHYSLCLCKKGKDPFKNFYPSYLPID